MLPDWDFGGDDTKRRAFVMWVETELDRWAGLLHDRYPQAAQRDDWAEILAASEPATRAAHRPPSAWDGMNAIVWEYELIRYMFGRYWPGRKRPASDPASAIRIAVNRGRRGLPFKNASPHRLAAHRAQADDLVAKLSAELKRRTPSAGRREAAADIAYLDTLPDHLFAR